MQASFYYYLVIIKCVRLNKRTSVSFKRFWEPFFTIPFQDFVDKAYQHFNIVLRNDPDHKKARIALKVQYRLVFVFDNQQHIQKLITKLEGE